MQVDVLFVSAVLPCSLLVLHRSTSENNTAYSKLQEWQSVSFVKMKDLTAFSSASKILLLSGSGPSGGNGQG